MGAAKHKTRVFYLAYAEYGPHSDAALDFTLTTTQYTQRAPKGILLQYMCEIFPKGNAEVFYSYHAPMESR